MNIEFVFGGSFDPLHIGHFNLVKEVVCFVKEQTSSKFVFRFLPCAVPALKNRSTSSFEERSDKLKEVFTDYFKRLQLEMIVDNREFIKTDADGRKSYTIDSLRELHKEDNGVIRFFILGADNLIAFNRWKDYLEIRNYCNLLVINRPGYSMDNWNELAESYGFKVKNNNDQLLVDKKENVGQCYYLPISEVDISSSQIREKIKNNQAVDKWLIESLKS